MFEVIHTYPKAKWHVEHVSPVLLNPVALYDPASSDVKLLIRIFDPFSVSLTTVDSGNEPPLSDHSTRSEFSNSTSNITYASDSCVSSFSPFTSTGPSSDSVGVGLFETGGGVGDLMDSIGAGIGTSDNGLPFLDDLEDNDDSGVLERRDVASFGGVTDFISSLGGVRDLTGRDALAFTSAFASNFDLFILSAFFWSKEMLGIRGEAVA